MSVSSNLQTQPAWLDTFPDANLAFGFDATGMWFSGDASETPYPIRTNYDIDGETTVVVVYTFVHSNISNESEETACPDQGICFFKADAEPYWSWGDDTSRIAVQYNCGNLEIEGQVNDEESSVYSTYTLTVDNTYTARVTYDPVAETITHELFDGASVEDTLLDTIVLENERLSAGAYRIGFHADVDTDVSDKAYFTYLEINAEPAAPVEIFTRVFRALHFPHRRRQTVSDVDLTPTNVQPGEVLYDETEGTVYAGLDDNTAVEIFSSGGGIGPNDYIESDVTGITGAVAVNNIVSMTQAAYDALATKDATTLYIING
jgi:hypothetical protein